MKGDINSCGNHLQHFSKPGLITKSGTTDYWNLSIVEICFRCPVTVSPWKGSTSSPGSQCVPVKSSSQVPWDTAVSLVFFEVTSDAVSPCGEHHASLHSRRSTGGISPTLCCRASHAWLCMDASCSHSCRAPGALSAVVKGRTDISKNLWAFTAWPHADSTKKHHLTRRCLWRSVKFLIVRSPICSRDNYQLFILPLVMVSHKRMGRSQSTDRPASFIPWSWPSFSVRGALLGLWRSGILHHSRWPLPEGRWILKRLAFQSKLWLIDKTSETTLDCQGELVLLHGIGRPFDFSLAVNWAARGISLFLSLCCISAKGISHSSFGGNWYIS